MKKLLFASIILICASIIGFAQSYDEKIGNAMNRGDWFGLDSIYQSAPKDSIHPFLEVYSRCLIGNRFNRPDISIPAFTELFDTQSEYLDLGNMLNSSVMFAMDLSRTGDNEKAAHIVSSVLDATRQHLDSAAIVGMQKYVNQYTALAAYKPYGIDFGDRSNATIPFRFVPVGPAKKNSLLMHLDNCAINGIAADITFDTGAGVNIISDSLAQKFGLIPLNANLSVSGMGVQTGGIAIAKELKLGSVTLSDVPFTIITITANNEEADQYMNCFDIIVGSELMSQLKDLTLDFANRQINIPATPPAKSDATPNMCFSPSMNLLARGDIHGNSMLMCIDSGDASFGWLDKTFFEKNREYVIAHGQPDSLRMAGIGGVHISQGYRVPDIEAQLGGSGVIIPQMDVRIEDNPAGLDYECNFGLKSLMLFGKVRFNMVDFTITTYPYTLSLNPVQSIRSAPKLIVTPEKGMTPLQVAGCIVVGVGKILMGQNGSDNPDL